jgi:hypothetical protein
MPLFEELLAEVQCSLDESTRMVMESTPDATKRALRVGATRAASLLEARIAQGLVEEVQIGALRQRFRSGVIPDKGILKRVQVPPWLGKPGRTAWDVVAGADAA